MSLLNHPKIRAYRKRKYQGVASGTPPESTPLTLVQNGTVYIPMGFAARLRVYARDEAGTDLNSDAGAFESSNTGIFRVVSVVGGPDIDVDGFPDYWEVLLAAVSVGTATLSEYVDAECGRATNESVVPVTDSLTVVVHHIATEIVAFYTEEDGGSEMEVQEIAADTFVINLPINKNATFRVEGRVGKAIVPLSNIVFNDGGSSNFHVVATADPAVVTIVTDAIFLGGDPLVITADGNPNPDVTASLSLTVTVKVSQTAPTNLVEFYSIEPRG